MAKKRTISAPHPDYRPQVIKDDSWRGRDGRDSTTPGPPGPGFAWKAAWRPQQYQAMDCVEHEGSSWVAVRQTRREPSFLNDDWDLLAQAGKETHSTTTHSQQIWHEQLPATERLKCGEFIPKARFVYVGSDKKIYLASSLIGEFVPVGVSVDSFPKDTICRFLTSGVVEFNWNLTPGSTYYLTTEGRISDQSPIGENEFSIVCGSALTPNRLILNISRTVKL